MAIVGLTAMLGKRRSLVLGVTVMESKIGNNGVGEDSGLVCCGNLLEDWFLLWEYIGIDVTYGGDEINDLQ